ncbi:molybdenum cofactor guanylyltransferase MobA [Cohaesibacter intestini]|uniref:molybdenum cofactor guanylyltransferase MobA n=1 Tax=Cohaesibacter intestini TaxID=2211145 RepID=UPI000DE930C8|nr:molybdenum cofactor guanylyltransferase MobA [Cohaesibacter intestini]
MTGEKERLEALDLKAMDLAGQLAAFDGDPALARNRWAHRTLGVVLAGGQSSRMGGQDKALIEIDGETMLSHCATRLQPQVGKIVVSGHDGDERFGANWDVVGDLLPDHAGPLSGILSAMRWAEANAPEVFWIATVAVDTPFFPDTLVDRFIMAMGGPEPAIVLAQSGDRVHPTFGLWPIALADSLEAFLASGERKTRLWAESQTCSHAHFSGQMIDDIEIDPFFNVNEPDDVPVAEAIASGLKEQAEG